MKKAITLFLFCTMFILQHSFAQTSPWGTGNINNQLIGNLVDSTVMFPSNSGFGHFGYYPNPNNLLPTYTYDIYIPPSYDGTEPYGLVTFINSGNGGGIISSWQTVLDEKKLIWIAGDNIGNSVNVDIRMGVAIAGVYRLQEILNIDSSRIYTAGNSGGARTATVLAYTYPEVFYGTLSNCGSNYLRQVDQDYETHQPNSHYEYTMPFSATDLEYVRSFDRRYTALTSYDDFREGDIMNVYHNGWVPDGFKGKFLETPGPHCATTTEHFRDAVNFVEHPHIPVIVDSFDSSSGLVGNGFQLKNAQIQNHVLSLNHQDSGYASAYAKTIFHWNDPKGSIIDTRIHIDSSQYDNNTQFHMGLWEFTDATIVCDAIGTSMIDSTAGILATISFDNTQPTLYVVVENPHLGLQSDTIFQASFNDWNASDSIHIRYHLWHNELRMEFSNHFNSPDISSTGAKLLDDRRSIQLRWAWFGYTGIYWDTTSTWTQGALLTLSSEKINPSLNSTVVQVEDLQVVVADTLSSSPSFPLNTVAITANNNDLSVPMGLGAYQWYYNGNPLLNETTDQITASQSGVYYVEIYAGSNCAIQSDSVNLTMLSSDVYPQQPKVRIYPNPSRSHIQIDSEVLVERIEFLNLLGQSVYQKNMHQQNGRCSTHQLPAGTYILQVYGSEGLIQQERITILQP